MQLNMSEQSTSYRTRFTWSHKAVLLISSGKDKIHYLIIFY